MIQCHDGTASIGLFRDVYEKHKDAKQTNPHAARGELAALEFRYVANGFFLRGEKYVLR